MPRLGVTDQHSPKHGEESSAQRTFEGATRRHNAGGPSREAAAGGGGGGGSASGADHPPEPPVYLSGYLHKLKSKSTLVGGFVKRWFRVCALQPGDGGDGGPNGGELQYFATREDAVRGSKPKERIPMSDVVAVRDFDETSFQVVTRRRSFFLRGESAGDHDRWLNALQAYAVELRDWRERNTPLLSS